MSGLFDDLFDFNNDGKLDTFERTAEFMAYNNIMNSSENANEFGDDNADGDDFWE